MVKINFVGDFFAYHPNKIKFDDNLIQWLKEADISVCNFEGPIDTANLPLSKSGPNISQSIYSISFLKQFGFNVFSLGNNHAMDYGEKGLIETKKAFNINDTVGAGNDEEAYSVLVKHIDNVKIGFIAATHYEFGICSDQENYGVAWINDPRLDKLISSTRPKVDYLFILPHAGVENIDIPLPIWRKRYKNFIDLGIDGVIGSHPHVPQGVEIYKGKPIYYSLGNFFFERMNGSDSRHMHSIIVRIIIDSQGKITVKDRVVKRNDYEMKLLAESDGKYYLKPLDDILRDDSAYQLLVNNEVLHLWQSLYKKQIYYAVRRPSLKFGIIHNLKMMVKLLLGRKENLLLLNCFRCESHRWLIERALETNL